MDTSIEHQAGPRPSSSLNRVQEEGAEEPLRDLPEEKVACPLSGHPEDVSSPLSGHPEEEDFMDDVSSRRSAHISEHCMNKICLSRLCTYFWVAITIAGFNYWPL